jgi:hypothetical protein
MATEGKKAREKAARFHNRLYRAEVGQTPAGSPTLKVTATDPSGGYAQHRQMAAFVYELAADMERRSEALGARWVISPEATNGRVVLEVAGDQETALAVEFVASVIADNNLA